jgi:hypothetical protein
MALRPATERLEADLGSRANLLRVSIHTDFGQQLGERYRFESTPLFVVLDATGAEVWRGSKPPSIDTVLKEN